MQDPQAVARTILDQAVSGNMTGIDDLIAKQRTLAVRLGQVRPPPACREHHDRSVRLFARAIALLEKTRDASDIRRSAGLPPVS